MHQLGIVGMGCAVVLASAGLLSCDQGSGDTQPAPQPDPAKPVVFFERTVEVGRRATAQYEFECKEPCTMRLEVKPDGTTYVSLESPGGSPLLNEYKIKTGEELDKEVKAEKAGRYTLRLKNSNLVEPKRVSVKITSKP